VDARPFWNVCEPFALKLTLMSSLPLPPMIVVGPPSERMLITSL